ncbi:MAG: pyridoxal phosphate-dependent aminotransferase [Pseudomonadota bacterium]|nr:pyridoxal phosphate-dependent aminotransferase [Pseudomonadota bacterium]
MALTARANEMRQKGTDVIILTVGEPDFDTPNHIKKAAQAAITSGSTKYTAVDGTTDLKEAIIHKLKNDNGLMYSPDQIIASNGCKQSLFNFLQVFLDEGDEVIIPTPYWVSYVDMVKYAGGVPVFLETTYENNLNIDSKKLEQIISNKTKLLLLNSPNNPSGKYFSSASLENIAKVLLGHEKIFVASDDIYEHVLWHKEKFHNILNVCQDLFNRTIIFNGVSKVYAMTGWRIGYAAGPKEIVKAMRTLQSQSTSCPSSVSQAAACEALTKACVEITQMNIEYKNRHDMVIEGLNKIDGVECKSTDGTFYIFPSFKELIKNSKNFDDDRELASYLLEEAKIAVVPGSSFGFAGHLRISIAVDMNSLQEAVSRMQRLLKT